MTTSPFDLNPEAFDLACKELFLTITAHKSAADVLGFDWKSLKASTRKPWETATRKVLTAYLDEDLTEEANTRMAAILLATANALKGEPAPMSAHSWHDLAEVASDLKARAEADEAKAATSRRVAESYERELLQIQGPCRAPGCGLHRAHNGPCNITTQGEVKS